MIERTAPLIDNDRCPGWRLLAPVWRTYKKAYDISSDQLQTGWWKFIVSFSCEPLGCGDKLHGFSFRVTWGWVYND